MSDNEKLIEEAAKAIYEAQVDEQSEADVVAAMKEWRYGVGDDWSRMRSALQAARAVDVEPQHETSLFDAWQEGYEAGSDDQGEIAGKRFLPGDDALWGFHWSKNPYRPNHTNKKGNDMCTICGTNRDDLTIGSDGKTTACADCMGSAVDE